MRGVLHVTARTLVERRNVFVAAAVAALLPVLYSYFPWVGPENTEDLRAATALVIAAGFSLAVALLYGATCLARDMRERRLSFYFSRPLPAASLWAGRMLAGLLLAGATLLIVLLPSILAGPLSRVDAWPLLKLAAAVAGGLLAAVALGHALAVMLASRSGWLAVDLVAVVISGGGAAAILRLISRTGDGTLLAWFGAIVACAGAAGLVAAGLAQVAIGRTDLRTGHRALSLTLWATCAAALVALAGYTLYLLNPTPRSLTRLDDVLTASGGDVIVVSGSTRWRSEFEATFAVDTASGRHVRLGRPANRREPAAVSADGARVVWLESLGRPGASPVQVMTLDLSRLDEPPRETRIVLGRHGADALAVSGDGRLIALLEDDLLTVLELDSGRLLASARLAEKGRTTMTFASRHRLRVEQRVQASSEAPTVLVVSALDLPAGRLYETGRRPSPELSSYVVASSAGFGSVVIRDRSENGTALVLHDGWTLARRAELGRKAAPGLRLPLFWGWYSVAALADGRVVIGDADRRGARLAVFTPAGAPERVVELGPWRDIRVGAEVAPGRLAVSLAKTASVDWGLRTIQWDECAAVDLATGERAPIGGDLTPLAALWPWLGRTQVRPGSVGARLFLAPDRLVLWDPGEPGTLRTVLETGRS